MIKWDVKLGDPIEYFDPNLSYEITGYRPITEDKGLDFDVTPFIEAGQIKIKTNRYCPHPVGTKQHRDFWTEQHKRCKYGFESNGYRITGDHYFFLNFYKLQAVEGVVATGSGRDTTFPRFMQAQYEYFHYIAIAESVKKDVVTLKSRGVGWSEIQAAMAACKYTTTPKYISLFTAYYEDYLLGTGGVLTKCWDNLEYLNTDTEKGMRRLRQAVNTQFRKRQSLLDKEKNETGHMAEISAIIVDKPRKLRGTRVDRLFFEEAGSNENLTKLWIQSLALVSVQGNKFGTRVQFGCVTQGNKVWTSEGKLINIEDLQQEEGIVGYNGQDSYRENIVWMKPPQKKLCYRITTTGNNYIECSYDHPLLSTWSHHRQKKTKTKHYSKKVTFTLAEDLKVGDQLVTIDKLNIFGAKHVPDARLFGLMIGDGNCTIGSTPSISCGDDEIYNFLKENYNITDGKQYIQKNSKRYIQVSLKGIKPKLIDANLYGLVKENKRLPKDIHTYSKESLANLIGGYFDADGCVVYNKKKNRIRLCLTSAVEELLNQIKFELLRFGIHSSVVKERRKKGYVSNKDVYRLYIQGFTDIKRFQENITLLCKQKQDLLNTIDLYENRNERNRLKNVTFEINKTNNKGTFFAGKTDLKNLYKETITKIECVGEKEVYNLNAEYTHTYLSNGYVTANTGGDTGPQLIGLEKMFFNPEAYNVLPYKHNYSKNGEYILSAYFVPQYACQVKFLDERGVTNKTAAKAYFEKEREKLLNDIEEYLVNCQEYCFTPEEQLSRQGVNSFNQVKLAQQRMEIEVYKTRPKPERGNFEWIKDGDGSITGVKWVKSSTGKVLMLEPPVRDANNKVIQNLYVAGIDSIDHGVSDSVVGEKGSKFCALVKKRAFGNMGNKYVCLYLERPPQAKQQYEIAQQMLWFYSCKANLEDTKITFRAYLRERRWDHKMLMKRPQYGLESQGGRPRKSNSNLWGTPGSPKMIEHGLELITDYIEDFYENMDFLEMIDQLQRFSYENKGLFDIVSAMIMTEIGDEDMYNLKIKESQEERTTRKDIGYYIDERGIKRWGIIPTQQQNLNNKVCPPKAWRII